MKAQLIRGRNPSAVAKVQVKFTPQIARRAYELYEQQGHQDGHATQDWDHTEKEIQKGEAHK